MVESTVRPRWRPSNVRMTHRRNAAVVPRRGMVALPALASGVGLALSLPPWGWWILAFPAAGLLWWRLGGLRPRTRLWAGYLAGLGCYVPGLMWARSFTVPGAIVLIAVEAGFTAVACLAVPAGAGRGPGAGLPGGPDPGRGGPDGLALRGAAHRRRVPRTGRRAGPRRRPPGRSPGPHRHGLPRGGGGGSPRRGGGPCPARRGPGPGVRHPGARRAEPGRGWRRRTWAGVTRRPGRSPASDRWPWSGWWPAWWWSGCRWVPTMPPTGARRWAR